MKRTLLIFSAALTLCCQQMAAQGIAIRHTDGTFTTILTPGVDYITTNAPVLCQQLISR